MMQTRSREPATSRVLSRAIAIALALNIAQILWVALLPPVA